MGSPFLDELWERRAESERGKSYEETALQLYLDLKSKSEHNAILEPLFLDVEKSALRYLESMNCLALHHRRDEDIKLIEEADLNRRRAHDVFIDSVNILSREFKRAGLDNSWRRNIGLNRNSVAKWGEQIGVFLIEQAKREEEEGRAA